MAPFNPTDPVSQPLQSDLFSSLFVFCLSLLVVNVIFSEKTVRKLGATFTETNSSLADTNVWKRLKDTSELIFTCSSNPPDKCEYNLKVKTKL